MPKSLKRIITSVILITLCVAQSLQFNPSIACAQNMLGLPEPGTMIGLTPTYNPALIQGITIYPDNPLQFDFIIDTGDDHLEGDAFKNESTKLIKYFLASLTVPEDEMWVNLSPYEKDRIVPDAFGQTEMGRDLLAQDYMLKQLTASLMYPEEELGARFWDNVYEEAQKLYGTTNIPTNTFNKVWIVPEKAAVYVNGTNVFVSESHLKVMLEEDYLALEANHNSTKHGLGNVKKEELTEITDISTEVIREVIIPAIEKEVNEGKTFANLRQIYNASILATWYKQNLQQSLLGQKYVDQNKITGVDIEDKDAKLKIYDQYVTAFKKGVYNFIKEDYDPATQKIIPRKYFSGGAVIGPKKLSTASSPATVQKLKESLTSSLITVVSWLGKLMNVDNINRLKGIQRELKPFPFREFRGKDNQTYLTLPSVWSQNRLNDFYNQFTLEDSRTLEELEINNYGFKFNSYETIDFITKNKLQDAFPILDIGAGQGTFLKDIITTANKMSNDPDLSVPVNVEAHAFEIQGVQQRKKIELMTASEKKIADIINSEIKWEYGLGAETLPYQDNQFSLIFGGRVLEYGYDPLRVLEESYRVLMDGGIARFSVSFLNRKAYDNISEYYRGNSVKMIDDSRFLGHMYLDGINIFQAIKELQKLGFDVTINKKLNQPVEITDEEVELFMQNKDIPDKEEPFVLVIKKHADDLGPLKFPYQLNGIDNPSHRKYKKIDQEMLSTPTKSERALNPYMTNIETQSYAAAITEKPNKGGIDLNPNITSIETEGDVVDFNMRLDLELFQDITINGLTPVIINIAPVTNLNMLLGITEEKEAEQKLSLFH